MEDRVFRQQINFELAVSGPALGVAAGESDAVMVVPTKTMVEGADCQRTGGRTRTMEATRLEY
jgi:hypothetical protein